MFRDPTFDSTGALLVEVAGSGTASPSFRDPTYNSTTGALLIYVGAAIISSLTVTGLTNGRVPIIGAGGLFTDDPGLLYNAGTDQLTTGALIMSQVLSANVLATDGTGLVDARQSSALSVIGRSANSIGAPADIAAATDGEVLRRSGTTLGFGTIATAGIATDAVTFAKMQNVSAVSKLIGRGSAAGAGDPEEITIGSGLTMTGTTLSSSLAGGPFVDESGDTMTGLLTINNGGGVPSEGPALIVRSSSITTAWALQAAFETSGSVTGPQGSRAGFSLDDNGATQGWEVYCAITENTFNIKQKADALTAPKLRVTGEGRFGFNVAAPTATIHLRAGSTAASAAPLKFISGSLMTTAEAGAVEFLTDKFYGTITTGAARKEIALWDLVPTNGRIPFIASGRLTDHANLTYDSGTSLLTAGKMTVNDDLTVGDVLSVTGLSTFSSTVQTSTLIKIGGATSSFPMLKRSAAILQVRLADDSAYTDIDVNAVSVSGNFVLGPKVTGWTAPTGTASRAGYDTATATTTQLAQTLKALIDDIYDAGTGHGLIGA